VTQTAKSSQVTIWRIWKGISELKICTKWKFLLNITRYLFLIIRFHDYSYTSHWRSQIGMHYHTKSKNKFIEFRIWDSTIDPACTCGVCALLFHQIKYTKTYLWALEPCRITVVCMKGILSFMEVLKLSNLIGICGRNYDCNFSWDKL